MKKLAINTGFTTNSSSRVVHLPKELLDDPDVRALLEAYEVEDGFVGENVWDRSKCDTLALTTEQKKEARHKMENYYEDLDGVPINVENDDEAVIIYGDEYEGVVQEVMRLLIEKSDKYAGIYGPGMRLN